MLEDEVIDLWPFAGKIRFEEVPEIEDWERGNRIRRIEVQCPFGNDPVSYLNVVPEGEQFLVTHTTVGGRWIEHNRRRFRTARQAIDFAEDQSTGRTANGRLWTYEIDGRILWLDVKWDLHIQQEKDRLLTQPAG